MHLGSYSRNLPEKSKMTVNSRVPSELPTSRYWEFELIFLTIQFGEGPYRFEGDDNFQ